jgi:hypothetical protein
LQFEFLSFLDAIHGPGKKSLDSVLQFVNFVILVLQFLL